MTRWFLVLIISLLLFGQSYAQDLPPIIFIPGYSGSELIGEDGKRFWPPWDATPSIREAGEAKELLKALRLSPAGKDPHMLRPRVFEDYNTLFDTDSYGHLLSFLTQRLDYVVGDDLRLLAYDWRFSNVEHSKALNKRVDQLWNNTGRRVVIIAHSNGGLIARHYLNTVPEAKDRVVAVVQMGTPVDGLARPVQRIVVGFDIYLVDKYLENAVANALLSFPSVYEINSTGCLRKDIYELPVLSAKSWLDNFEDSFESPLRKDMLRRYLSDASVFRNRAKRKLPKEVHDIRVTSVNHETPFSVDVAKKKVHKTVRGDGTVSYNSATFAHSPSSIGRIINVESAHGALWKSQIFQKKLGRILYQIAGRDPAMFALEFQPISSGTSLEDLEYSLSTEKVEEDGVELRFEVQPSNAVKRVSIAWEPLGAEDAKESSFVKAASSERLVNDSRIFRARLTNPGWGEYPVVVRLYLTEEESIDVHFKTKVEMGSALR